MNDTDKALAFDSIEEIMKKAGKISFWPGDMMGWMVYFDKLKRWEVFEQCPGGKSSKLIFQSENLIEAMRILLNEQ